MQIVDIAAHVAQVEQQRCEALVRRDLEALDRLVDDALVHVHTTGRAETKAQYLDGVASRLQYLSVERESLQVRPFADAALATGVVRQQLRIVASGQLLALRIFVTQLWCNSAGGWRQCSFQATNLSGNP